MKYIILYLGAIVGANLLIAWLGIAYAIPVALVFVSLDFTSRDHLHEAWHQRGLVWKMGLLIATGSLLTWLINHNAGQVALASFESFVLASLADMAVYQLLYRRGYLTKVNGSNVASAFVDSLLFPRLAFGSFRLDITLGQFAAKVIGGAVWSWLLMDKSKRQDILCRLGWHKHPFDWNMTHEQCPHCKKIWESNPYWNT